MIYLSEIFSFLEKNKSKMKLSFIPVILVVLIILVSGCVRQDGESSKDTMESITKAIATNVIVNKEIMGAVNRDVDVEDVNISSLIYGKHIVDMATISWSEFPIEVIVIEIDSKDILNERWGDYIARLEEQLRNATSPRSLFTKSTKDFYGSNVTKFTGSVSLAVSNLRLFKHVWRDGKFIFIINDITDVTIEESSQIEIVYAIIKAYKFKR